MRSFVLIVSLFQQVSKRSAVNARAQLWNRQASIIIETTVALCRRLIVKCQAESSAAFASHFNELLREAQL
jgi:hypothetical protein